MSLRYEEIYFCNLTYYPFLTDAQNQNNTLKSWVYYELLIIDAKKPEEGLLKLKKIILRWLMNTGPSKSFDHAIILKNYGFFLIQQDRPDEGLKFLEWSLKKLGR